MRSLFFIVVLAIYGSSAMELHEWLKVPQVVVHLLEHHSDLGHHDAEGSDHGHEGDHDHQPFGSDHHESCNSSAPITLPMDPQGFSVIITSGITLLAPSEMATALSDYSGSKWNPPKLG